MKGYWLQAAWLLTTAVALALFLFHIVWLVQYLSSPPPGLIMALDASGISYGVFVFFNLLNQCGLFLGFFLPAQLIFLRRGEERFPVIAAFALVAFGTVFTTPAFPEFYAFTLAPPLFYRLLVVFMSLLFAVFFPIFFITYPDGMFVPRAARGVAVVFSLFMAVFLTTPVIYSLAGPAAIAIVVMFASVLTTSIYIQFWRYRNYLQPLQKQQVKWFLLGIAITSLSLLPWVVFSQVWTTPDQTQPSYIPLLSFLLVSALANIALPVSIGIAILKYRLWDIDVLLRRTVTYALVTGTLLLVFFGSVVVLQQILASVTGGGQSELVTVLSTLAIAALFVPLRNRIQNAIDRRFNRSKYDAQQVMTVFAEAVRDETDLEQLGARLVEVVHKTMQPASVSIWLNDTELGRKTINRQNGR